MKMYLGNTPINRMNIKHFEMDTNDCTMVASDLQAGKTAVAKGKKVTGTGKSFEFANYGYLETNTSRYVPNVINIIGISSLAYPIKQIVELNNQRDLDFTTAQHIADVVIEDVFYPITVKVNANFLTVACDQSVRLQVFYGKDNYV